MGAVPRIKDEIRGALRGYRSVIGDVAGLTAIGVPTGGLVFGLGYLKLSTFGAECVSVEERPQVTWKLIQRSVMEFGYSADPFPA